MEVQPTAKPEGDDDEEKKPLPVSIIKSDVFVIQKYIERPLLVKDRKFDIRLWVLISQEHKCYLFKEGYARLTSYKYSLAEETMDNLAVHLTNNAIQKKDKNYGREEDGNIMSYKQMEESCGVDMYELVDREVKPIIESTLLASRLKVNKHSRRFCFEIFGYDFMIDSDKKPWLIEVNTNPALEESNAFLRQLVPRMLDDAFKLTLDVVYPPREKEPRTQS